MRLGYKAAWEPSKPLLASPAPASLQHCPAAAPWCSPFPKLARPEPQPTQGLTTAFQRTTCFWPQRRRDRSTCSMTTGSSSEAWRSASEPKAGTSGRSPGAQARRGTWAWTCKKSAQGPFFLHFFPGGTSCLTPGANSFTHLFIHSSTSSCACAGYLRRQSALDIV